MTVAMTVLHPREAGRIEKKDVAENKEKYEEDDI